MNICNIKNRLLSNFPQITAFYEDNYPEVMKNIFVIKGGFLVAFLSPYWTKNYFKLKIMERFSQVGNAKNYEDKTDWVLNPTILRKR